MRAWICFVVFSPGILSEPAASFAGTSNCVTAEILPGQGCLDPGDEQTTVLCQQQWELTLSQGVCTAPCTGYSGTITILFVTDCQPSWSSACDFRDVEFPYGFEVDIDFDMEDYCDQFEHDFDINVTTSITKYDSPDTCLEASDYFIADGVIFFFFF